MEKNNFKLVEADYDAPESIKQEVSASLGFFRNAGRIFDLYLGKVAWLFAGLLRGHHEEVEQIERGHTDFGESDPPNQQLDDDEFDNRNF
ncbi:MAG: hypothetical protein AAF502_10030 [Bacteroidota bacterium]